MKPCENLELLNPTLLRKYIAYARKYVPEVHLSEEAKNTLQEFYVYLRQNHHTKDTTPVTNRQLLSLIRLTQVFNFSKFFVLVEDSLPAIIRKKVTG